MEIRVFGRSGCARTRQVLLRLKNWVSVEVQNQVSIRFFDLETAEGLAEAAFQQLEGDLPVVLVETGPGWAISGDPPPLERKLLIGDGVATGPRWGVN